MGRPGETRRIYVYGATEREARDKLRAVKAEMPLDLIVPKSRIARRHFNVAAVAIATAVLARGRALNWPEPLIAQVLVASMNRRRVEAGIVGPCVYCGDELANTVDHVNPKARGGGDEPGNLVSACARCNNRKGTRTPDEWRASEAAQ